MTMSDTTYDPTIKQKAEAKTSRIPIKIVPAEVLKKPDWIRVKAGSPSTRSVSYTHLTLPTKRIV